MLLRLSIEDFGYDAVSRKNMLEVLEQNGWHSKFSVVSHFTNVSKSRLDFLQLNMDVFLRPTNSSYAACNFYFIKKDYVHNDPLSLRKGDVITYMVKDPYSKKIAKGLSYNTDDTECVWEDSTRHNMPGHKLVSFPEVDFSFELPVSTSIIKVGENRQKVYKAVGNAGLNPIFVATGEIIELNDGALCLKNGVMITVDSVLDPMKLIPFMA